MTPFSKQISNLDDFYNTPKEWRKIPVVVACAIGHVGGHVSDCYYLHAYSCENTYQ